MPKNLPKYLEFRLFAVLGSIALAIYLLQVLSGFLSMFSDIALIFILSWLLAFILNPVVHKLTQKGLSQLSATSLVYFLLAMATMAFSAYVIPTTITQLSNLTGSLPQLFANAPIWAGRVEGIISSALSNSVSYAQALASFLTGLLLVAIVSFYLVLERSPIEKFIKQLIPEKYREDYEFFQTTLNTTFASFLRIQVVIGLIVGVVTIAVLAIFSIEFALSAGLLAGLLAMIPVVGPIISIIPPLLAAATFSMQKGIITTVVLFLIYQLIYNIVAPKLVGSALKIHPVLVILSFIVGYKLAGPWGAIFAVPITVSIGIIFKELIHYWQEEAN